MRQVHGVWHKGVTVAMRRNPWFAASSNGVQPCLKSAKLTFAPQPRRYCWKSTALNFLPEHWKGWHLYDCVSSKTRSLVNRCVSSFVIRVNVCSGHMKCLKGQSLLCLNLQIPPISLPSPGRVFHEKQLHEVGFPPMNWES